MSPMKFARWLIDQATMVWLDWQAVLDDVRRRRARPAAVSIPHTHEQQLPSTSSRPGDT